MEENIKLLELNSGEYVGMEIIKITSIPSEIILKDSYVSGTNIEEEYKIGIGNLLSEIFQEYKNNLNRNKDEELSIELLWLTEPVENQPYKAEINLYMIARSISDNQNRVVDMVNQVINSCISNLKFHQYGNKIIPYTELEEQISKIPIESIQSLVKEENLEMIQNQMLPYCLSFNRFGSCASNLGNIINGLIEHPYSGFSIQLIPTKYTTSESSTLSQIAQILDTLSKGVASPGLGNVSFSIADIVTDTFKYYQTNRNNTLFKYNILVFGNPTSVNEISSKIYGYMTYDNTKPVALKNILISLNDLDIKTNVIALPWLANEYIIQTKRNQKIWSNKEFKNLYRLPYIITGEEATDLFRLPIGTNLIGAGLPVNESERKSKTYSQNLINTGDIEIGKLKNGNHDAIGMMLKDLTKHMLVVGTPGSGKTTFSVGLLDRLWKEHHIPFLVIEPAKNEYRSLVQSIPDIQVFTPGKNFISPFVFNPFVPPKNVKLETYKSTLKTAFAAGVSMTTPLDKIFEESINNCYSDFRWLDTYTINDKGKIFNISDFIKCFQETFDEIGYTGDAKNIGRAGLVRLNSLVNLFDNYSSIPIEDILQKPTIIELAAIENSDQKALIISLLLLSILAYVNANYVGEGSLKNVILLEEAHVLLDASSNREGDANPAEIAQGLVKRMLAEIRSYGVGLVIADQSPRKVTTDVVALTDMKVVFRLVESQDKQIIADSMNMSEAQVQRLSRLKPGEAFLFFNRLEEPEEIITPDYRLQNNISISLSDEGIKSLSTYWKDKQEKLRPYPECQKIKYCEKTCDYNCRILAREIARRIYNHNFKKENANFETLKEVFSHIVTLTKEELNDEPFSKELLGCVKVHLWRKIIYNTKIKVTQNQIDTSLEKS